MQQSGLCTLLLRMDDLMKERYFGLSSHLHVCFSWFLGLHKRFFCVVAFTAKWKIPEALILSLSNSLNRYVVLQCFPRWVRVWVYFNTQYALYENFLKPSHQHVPDSYWGLFGKIMGFLTKRERHRAWEYNWSGILLSTGAPGPSALGTLPTGLATRNVLPRRSDAWPWIKERRAYPPAASLLRYALL